MLHVGQTISELPNLSRIKTSSVVLYNNSYFPVGFLYINFYFIAPGMFADVIERFLKGEKNISSRFLRQFYIWKLVRINKLHFDAKWFKKFQCIFPDVGGKIFKRII